MSESIQIATFLLPADTNPDWLAAKEWAETLPEEQLITGNIDAAFRWSLDTPPQDADARRTTLIHSIDSVEDAFQRLHKRCVVTFNGALLVYAYAHLDYDDTPLYEAMCLFTDTNAYVHAGFLSHEAKDLKEMLTQ